MSLYRQARGSGARTALIAVVAALLAGFAGFLIGREAAPEPALSEQIAEAREAARPALSSLELVGIEYEQGFEASATGGPTELQAARDHAAAAAAALDDAQDLETVDPAGLEAARAAIAELEAAIARGASVADVRELIADARAAVEELSGGEATG